MVQRTSLPSSVLSTKDGIHVAIWCLTGGVSVPLFTRLPRQAPCVAILAMTVWWALGLFYAIHYSPTQAKSSKNSTAHPSTVIGSGFSPKRNTCGDLVLDRCALDSVSVLLFTRLPRQAPCVAILAMTVWWAFHHSNIPSFLLIEYTNKHL